MREGYGVSVCLLLSVACKVHAFIHIIYIPVYIYYGMPDIASNRSYIISVVTRHVLCMQYVLVKKLYTLVHFVSMQ